MTILVGGAIWLALGLIVARGFGKVAAHGRGEHQQQAARALVRCPSHT